jgi:hypothetical protein
MLRRHMPNCRAIADAVRAKQRERGLLGVDHMITRLAKTNLTVSQRRDVGCRWADGEPNASRPELSGRPNTRATSRHLNLSNRQKASWREKRVLPRVRKNDRFVQEPKGYRDPGSHSPRRAQNYGCPNSLFKLSTRSPRPMLCQAVEAAAICWRRLLSFRAMRASRR